ncbi:MAG: carboxylating nicotinate-nucleotide diphosphorylase [Elusimicrobiota bacterium]|jgi:nicotinate-nucleotide pyrophosphorylase (carboxylating)
MPLDPLSKRLIRLALDEDLGKAGDLSTRCFLPAGLRVRARFILKQDGVLFGMQAASEVFRLAAPKARLRWLKKEGSFARRGTVIGLVKGGREVLTAERTSLNLLQRLSGVATLAREYVLRAKGTRARIYDTRKTTPGLRILEKAAVRAGGGSNHRLGLHDMVMLKDNHMGASSETELASRLRAFRRKFPRIPVEIEARDHAEVEKAARLGADVIMLDNMPPAVLRREILWLRRHAPKAEIEISGGVSLPRVRALAKLGPDRISVGKLTHSAPALDISMKLDPRIRHSGGRKTPSRRKPGPSKGRCVVFLAPGFRRGDKKTE